MSETIPNPGKMVRRKFNPLRGILPFEPPEPGEIKGVMETLLGGASEAREIGTTLLEQVKDADEKFREADRTIRSVRFSRGRRRRT